MQAHKFSTYAAIQRLVQMLTLLKVVRIYQPVILKCSKFEVSLVHFEKLKSVLLLVGWLISGLLVSTKALLLLQAAPKNHRERPRSGDCDVLHNGCC